MPARPLGSIVEVEPGRFRVRVSGACDPATGQRRRRDRTIYGTRRDAERLKARLLLEIGTVPDASSLTLSAYLTDMWYPALERRRVQGKIRRMTIDGYRSKITRHVTPHLGGLKLAKLDPYTLDRWLGALAQSGVSPHTAHHAYRVLHTALQQAVRWRLLASSPLAGVEVPTVPTRDGAVLSADEANAMLDAFRGHELEPIVVIALGAGLRRSELAALTWADVDFAAGTVKVWRGLHQRKGETWYESPKTKRSTRTISLPGWALALLKPLRALGPLVVEDGAPMNPDHISDRFRAHAQASPGVKDIPLRDLRHSHATIALASGVDVAVVSRRLGHSNLTTTDRYLRPGRAADEDAARKLDGMRATPDVPDIPATRGGPEK